MKKLVCLSIGLLCFWAISAQKLKVNTIDKFTQFVFKETTEESFGTDFINNFRFTFKLKYSEKQYSMPAVITFGKQVQYDENSGIALLLDDNSTIRLYSRYSGLSTPIPNFKGEVYFYSFKTEFFLNEDQVSKLRDHKVTDIRIYYMDVDGVYDYKLKSKKQMLIQRMLKLFD